MDHAPVWFHADLEAEGHTVVRCKAEKVDKNEANTAADGDASVPVGNDAPAAEVAEVGDWNAGDSGAGW